MRNASTPLKVGLVAGIAFYLHAMIPDSNAWPLLWPAAGGAVATILAARRVGRTGFPASVGAGLKAGAVAGVLFFLATAASLLILSSPSLTSVARQLGAEGPINVSAGIVLGLALAAALGTALAALSAGAAYPLAKPRA
jgi:hypothetical protein